MTQAPQPVVLVVDDDAVLRSLVADVVRGECGLAVVTAGDGAEGWARVRELRPAVVVFDVRMSAVDGFGFCGLVRRDPSLGCVRLVALSGLEPRDGVRAQLLAAGCDDVVSKPFDLDGLVAAVARHLPADGRR
jgi:CheY-like chemotaxis protein